MGAAYQGLGEYEDAIQAYKKGLESDSQNDALKSGLADAEAANKRGGGGMGALGNAFKVSGYRAVRALRHPRNKR